MGARKPVRLAAVGVGLGLLGMLAGPSAQGEIPAGRVLGNTRLDTGTDPLRGRDIPGMAVDPADPRHIVLIDEDFLGGQCDFHVSYDGGKTWKGDHLTAPTDFADPPCRTFDSGGYAHYNKSVVFGTGQNVYTTFASHRGPQQRPETGTAAGEGDSVIVNRSTDGGKTFERGVVAIPGATDSRPFIIRPGIAVQPRPQGDRLYVVGWYVVNPLNMGAAGGAGDRRAVVSSSDDGGKTWSPAVEAQAPDEKVREIAPPVVGPDGSVYIAWRNRDDPSTAPHPIEVAKSSDGGKTWTRTAVGSADPAPTNIPAPTGGSGFPRMAVDPRSGALYVVYDGFQFGDLDVVLQRSTDGGATWSPPVRVNDDPKGDGFRQLGPQVFVAPNGRVDVIWLDTRTTYPSAVIPKPAGNGDIYYASSTDGGATFSANRRISDHTINLDEGLTPRIGSYTWWGPAEAPLGNDAVLFAWSDPRFGNVDNDTNDIMLATLQLGNAGPAAVTKLPKASAANLSVAASQQAYPGGAERIGANFTTKLVVVDKNDVAAAWAAAVLARANSSPLIVVDGKLTKAQKDEIKRVGATGMFVVGNTSAISDQLVKDITAAGIHTNIQNVTTTVPTTVAPTTVAPTTSAPTASASSVPATTAVPATTTTTLATSTANRTTVQRITGATAADMAKAVADAMDVRTDDLKAKKVPAFGAAVVVNPASEESATALAFAASQRYPILYVDKDAIPTATADALNNAAVTTTYVVGGTDSVSDAIMSKLPGAKRLGGADIDATATAVNNEIKARGLPGNIVYVAKQSRSVDAAIAAATVARVGGILLVTPGASTAAADKLLNGLGLSDSVDRMVVVQSPVSHGASAVLFVIIALFAVAGLVLLGLAFAKSRGAAGGAGSKRTAPTPKAEAAP